MAWEKLGLVFAPNAEYPWMISHAANPFAEHLDGDRFRIYFTCRDAQQRSHIAWVIVNLVTLKVEKLAEQPLLGPGQLGTFDDSGVALGWVLNRDGEKLFYYLGWNLGVTVPWRNSIGLARYNSRSETLDRVSLAPLMDRNAVDPYSISYPCVLAENGTYRMWYGSNLAWGAKAETMQHVIKYATSPDGYTWNRSGEIAIGLEGGQYALSKPCVVRDGEKYKMWYSFRGDSYRIGYAQSKDGINWQRKDSEVGIDVGASGWDSEMICYGHIFDHAGQRLMIYNGNGYGRTGFGIARQV